MNQSQIDIGWTYLVPAGLLAQLHDTPFLSRCRRGLVTGGELATFVRQQFHYARHFTRYLCALIANMEDERDRQQLTQNLFEEMGLGAPNAEPHAQIYRRMMAHMGIRAEDQAPFAETRELVETMFRCCRSERVMVGLGALCLGAEAIVPGVYSTIVKGFQSVGEDVTRLRFFTLHIESDDDHALTMRQIIERELVADPASRADLERGAREAIIARVAFFGAIGDASRVSAA
jgi:pyrroloquinoline quinone (PQQ) biosynthesis protein C